MKKIINLFLISTVVLYFASCTEPAKKVSEQIIGKWKTIDYQNTSLSEDEKVIFEEERNERITNDVYTFAEGKVVIDNGFKKQEFTTKISEDEKTLSLTGADNNSFNYEITGISADTLKLKLNGSIDISLKKENK